MRKVMGRPPQPLLLGRNRLGMDWFDISQTSSPIKLKGGEGNQLQTPQIQETPSKGGTGPGDSFLTYNLSILWSTKRMQHIVSIVTF